MKNLYKTKKILALFCSVLIIVLLAGCADVFNPSLKKESGLTVTVLSDSINPSPRTLYPSAEQFTKYELYFEGPGGAVHTETLEDGKKSVIVKDLAEGEWTITATGYVLVKDPISDPEGTEYPAAEGTAAAVITNGINPNVNIKISAKREGENLANGYFVCSVDYPASKVNSAYMEIRDIEGVNSYGYKNLIQNPEGSIPLAPGFYLMLLRLYNNYQTVSKTEVIHIYENMETVGDFTFVDSDFADTLPLKLVNDITFEGQSSSYIYVYTESYNQLGSLNKDGESGEWSEFPLPLSYEGKSLIFRLEFYIDYNWIYKEFIAAPVRSGDKLLVDLGSKDFSMITFGGTVEFKLKSVNMPVGEIDLYADENYQVHIDSIYPDSDGNWSITVPEFESPTKVWIAIYYEDSSGGWSWSYYQTGESITVYNESKTDFALSYELNDIIISGTVTAFIDGVKPDRIEIEVSDYGDGSSYVGWITAVIADENGNWTVSLPEFAEPTVVGFAVLGYIDGARINFPGEPIIKELYKADTSESGITFTEIVGKVIKIGGTIDVQFPMSWGGVNVDTEEGRYFGYGSIQQDNTWGVLIEPLETETNLSFRVSGYGNIDGEYKNFSFINPNQSVVIKDQDITDIHLIVSAPAGDGYKVTAPNSIQDGSIYVNKTYAKEGETVRISVYPNSGYRLKAGTLSATGAVVSRVMDTNIYVFTMPASNVTVSGEFEKIRNPLLPDPPTSAVIYLNNGATGSSEVYTISSGEPYKELVIVFDSSLQGSEVDFSWTGENLNITPTRTDLDFTTDATNYGNDGCDAAMNERTSAYPFMLTLFANSFKVAAGGLAGGGDHEISDMVIKINDEEIPITHTYEDYPNLTIPLP